MNIIEELEKQQVEALERVRPVPEFGPGDTLRVNVKVVEGDRARVQAYEGVCIARDGSGLNESFTVRKISYGEGVERVFPVLSPLIDSIEVVRRGKVRRAKLYYLRGRRGKSARIAEKTDARGKKSASFKGFKRPKGEAENMTAIEGVSPELAKQLQKLGVVKYEQVASWTDDDIAKVDDALNLKGRIEREDWSAKARELMAEKTASEVPPEEPEGAAAVEEGKAEG